MSLKKFWGYTNIDPSHRLQNLPQWMHYMKEVYDFCSITFCPKELEEKPELWRQLYSFVLQAETERYPIYLNATCQGKDDEGRLQNVLLLSSVPMFHLLRLREQVEGLPEGEQTTEEQKMHLLGLLYREKGNLNDLRFLEQVDREERIATVWMGQEEELFRSFDRGTVCVLATENSKEEIWNALRSGAYYGVSQGRMEIDCDLDGHVIGDEVPESEQARLQVHVKGDAAIDRVEVYVDNVLTQTHRHRGSWEKRSAWAQSEHLPLQMKLRIDFGWGQDLGLFKDLREHDWKIKMELLDGARLVSVARCWKHPGQRILRQEKTLFEAKLRCLRQGGEELSPHVDEANAEGFLFEIVGGVEDRLLLTVNGLHFRYRLKDLLFQSQLESESWMEFYQMRIHRAIPATGYVCHAGFDLDTRGKKVVHVRVHQENGALACLNVFHITPEA